MEMSYSHQAFVHSAECGLRWQGEIVRSKNRDGLEIVYCSHAEIEDERVEGSFGFESAVERDVDRPHQVRASLEESSVTLRECGLLFDVADADSHI
jgi:hypothetical protein